MIDVLTHDNNVSTNNKYKLHQHQTCEFRIKTYEKNVKEALEMKHSESKRLRKLYGFG